MITPTRQPQRTIDGNAVYARLIAINEESGDLSIVDKELQILIKDIKDGQYDCATHSSAPVPDEQCPYWKSSANLKSDFRDQDIGRFYCSRPAPPAPEIVCEDCSGWKNIKLYEQKVAEQIIEILLAGNCPDATKCVLRIRESLRGAQEEQG